MTTEASRRPPSRGAKSAIARLLATWFGCGYASVAPGTAGSFAALVIAVVLHVYAGAGRASLLLLTILLLVPGVWAAGVIAREEGQRDPHLVVIDEVLGQWLTLAGATVFNWKSFLAAFALFRILDIWKPPPVRQLEALPGGLGIVADDIMAGVYGALAIFLLDQFQLF